MYILPKILRKLRPAIVRKCNFSKDVAYEGGSILLNTKIDSHSYCGYDCKIFYSSIGKYTSIGDKVVIGLQDHRIDLLSSSPCFIKGKDSVKARYFDGELNNPKQTIIGNDVWIGENAMIKAGVVLGDGCVVGMGSVVTKDVPPYAIVAGNPAKIIRFRFDQKTIEFLLQYKWWELDEKTLSRLNGFDGKVDNFIAWAKNK